MTERQAAGFYSGQLHSSSALSAVSKLRGRTRHSTRLELETPPGQNKTTKKTTNVQLCSSRVYSKTHHEAEAKRSDAESNRALGLLHPRAELHPRLRWGNLAGAPANDGNAATVGTKLLLQLAACRLEVIKHTVPMP